MINGFVKVASVTPKVHLGDCVANGEELIKEVISAEKEGIKILLFPELSLVGYSIGDLTMNQQLLSGAKSAVYSLVEASAGHDVFFAFGFPYMYRGKIYNVAAAVYNGTLLGIVPKSHLTKEDQMYYAAAFQEDTMVFDLPGGAVNFGTKLIFSDLNMQELQIGIEIGEDLEGFSPVSDLLVENGATLILNLSCQKRTVNRFEKQKLLLQSASFRQKSAYMLSSAGEGESSTDGAYGGGNLIYELGSLTKECVPFKGTKAVAVLDVQKILLERAKDERISTVTDGVLTLDFDMPLTVSETKAGKKHPFIPEEPEECFSRMEEIIEIQSHALAQRLCHTHASAVVGLSGGLDSTLALLITVRAFDLLSKDRKEIYCITMPGFGTTKRTKSNAEILSSELGTSFECISIEDAVLQHFKDIHHDVSVTDVTYENAQARERTQILMDIANQRGALVIGTGDLSELALGFATYNGDQMSMYGVNADIPKTLVRYLVAHFAKISDNEKICKALTDILNTPVSPELLPPKENGEIAQCTEDTVGPYDLHDYFLYYFLRYGFSPSKIYRMAVHDWGENYSKETIKKWLYMFFRRFFMQQFKRSCMPDGPAVGSVSLSPRCGWKMPSDAIASMWLQEIEEL